ncbi:MAG: nucleotidyltransferase domain-containing protein [Candidatus Sericytochromatia bacterium]|nr:nucleotidyltransferase domain-containing protein [Candidatus Sericytochromatia bacterium]
MTETGLSPADLEKIRGVLRAYPEVRTAWLFGSRAKGCPRATSDIDLALEGPADALAGARIATALEELPLPWTFDVVVMATLTHPGLIEHIRRVGLAIYDRAQDGGRYLDPDERLGA